jgi:RNA polymerase sigma factor (sigma-70 family)
MLVMDEDDSTRWSVEDFERHRAHLKAVAYRMLGAAGEADDAVQEAWLRLNRADTTAVENPRGWLTTVVARVCLDMLRARKSRREEALGVHLPEPIVNRETTPDAEQEALLADSVGPALLVVLETLAPAERLAFVLHDMFAVPFEDIAPIVGRTPAAARQLASRARRRVQGKPTNVDADDTREREIVDAFVAASRDGNFQALLAVLDPEIVLRADVTAVRLGTRLGLQAEIRGADAVARTFSGRAQGAQRAVVGGAAGLVWVPGGQVRAAFVFTIADGKILEIELVADEKRLAALSPQILAG